MLGFNENVTDVPLQCVCYVRAEYESKKKGYWCRRTFHCRHSRKNLEHDSYVRAV
jgi:hypothetical protein